MLSSSSTSTASRRVFKAAARSLSTSQSSSAAAVNPPPKPLARTVRSSGKDDHAARAAERAETPASHGQVPRWQVKREEDLMRDDVYKRTKTIGSYQTDSEWHPSDTTQKPISALSVSVSHLVASAAHMGHHPSLTLPAYHPYLAGRRGGMDIINVEHTLPSLRKACGVVRDICRDDGVVVFIAGGREIMREPLMKAMERIGQANCHAVTGRYKPGTMTNAAVMHSPEIVLAGAHVPDLIILLDLKHMSGILREAMNVKVPVMAICDTDVDPRVVTFPIYSNVDSGRSAELIIGALARAGEEGVNARLGKPVGSQFPLLPGRFQARIDDSRHPDRVQQAFKWEGPPGMKDPMDLENERARAGRTGQGLPMRRDELYTLPLLTQPKEKRQ